MFQPIENGSKASLNESTEFYHSALSPISKQFINCGNRRINFSPFFLGNKLRKQISKPKIEQLTLISSHFTEFDLRGTVFFRKKINPFWNTFQKTLEKKRAKIK